MEFIISVVGTFIVLFIYKLVTGSQPDFLLRSDEIAEKNMYKSARKNIKNESPETAYQSIKYLSESFSKDQMLSDITIKLSKVKLHELASEALDSIQDESTRGLCILSGELDPETVEFINKKYDAESEEKE